MGRGCGSINKDWWGERDEGSFVEVAELVAMIGLRGVRTVDGIVGHEAFSSPLPRPYLSYPIRLTLNVSNRNLPVFDAFPQ